MSQFVIRKVPNVVKQDFWTSTKGREYVGYGVGALGVTVVCATSLSQTVFVENCINVFRSYKLGIARKVPENIQRHINTATELVQINPFRRNFIRSFVVTGVDVCDVGLLRSKYGGWVGVPHNYTYKNTDQVRNSDIQLNTKKILWNSEHGKMLKDSLVFTEDEQIFSFSRTLLELNSWKIACDVFIPTGTILAIYGLTKSINKRFNLLKAHRSLRVIMYSFIYFSGFGLYSTLTDIMTKRRERSIDTKLAALGPEWCDAGVRYYDKLLNRNVAIRGLSDDESYSIKGNINSFLREKSLPLTARKKFFETKLQQYQQYQQAKADETKDSEDLETNSTYKNVEW